MGDKSFGSTKPYLLICRVVAGARYVPKDVYPDGREFVGYGISPDIFVKPPSMNICRIKTWYCKSDGIFGWKTAKVGRENH